MENKQIMTVVLEKEEVRYNNRHLFIFGVLNASLEFILAIATIKFIDENIRNQSRFSFHCSCFHILVMQMHLMSIKKENAIGF